jgi:YYY domain-containing protein
MEVGLVALWVVLFLLLGLVALPISTWLFPERARTGLAIPVALATLAVVGHLVGHVAFGWPAVVAGLAVLVAGSYVAAGRTEVDWRSYGEVGVVFTLAFGLVVAIRAVDPAAAPLPIATGEKFLDFGLLRTLERSGSLPPEDMWFAGEPVKYYYGGHMLTVLLATLSDTAPRFAYNLALAGFYATLVSGAYGLAGAVVPSVPRRVAGGFAAFFVGIAGNLETAARVLVWLLPDSLAGHVVDATGLGRGAMEWTPAAFYYFDATRVIPLDATDPESGRAATEFPFFAWLNGDLHAHMMAQPFLLLTVGLLLAYWRLPAEALQKRLLVLVGLLPPVAGLVGFVSLWSFPTVAGLVALTVALAPTDPATMLPDRYADRLKSGLTAVGRRVPFSTRIRSRIGRVSSKLAAVAERVPHWTPAIAEARRVGFGLVAAAIVLVGGILWTLPFWTEVMLGGPSRSASIWDVRTPVGNLLLVHGAFLVVFAVALARRAGAELGRPLFVWGGGLAVLAVTVVAGFPALGLAGPLVLGGWWLVREGDNVGFATMLVVAGGGILLIVELATVEGERFNTIFKPYAQIWLLWAVAAAALLARLVTGWPARLLDADRSRLSAAGVALAVALVLTTGLYTPLALMSHANTTNQGPAVVADGPTLDATAYLEHQYPREAPAIRWVDRLAGQPTIVTAAPGGYFWYPDDGRGSSAPSSLTGVPAMLGWYHEAQYRGDEPYQQRLGDVLDIYTHENASYQRELLDYYNVEYVYVGPAERSKYGEITVDEVANVTVAEQFENVTIYAVG